jgi:hypothetical protein
MASTPQIPMIFPDHGNVVKMVPSDKYDSMRSKGGVRAYKMNFYSEGGGQKTLNASKWVPENQVEHFQKDLKGELVNQPGDTGGAIIDPKTGKPRGESQFGKDMTSSLSMASPVLATVGGLAGGALAGPAGAVSGAAVGGMAGKDLENKAAGKPFDDKGGALAGVEQGALEYVGGQVAPKILEKMGAKAVPKVYKAINNYIGLKPSDLPKWGRTAEEAEQIAETVRAEAGVKRTLPAQRDAIEVARKAHDEATVKLVQAPGGKVTDMHSVAINRAVNLLDEVEKEGVPQEQLNAIDKNVKGITDNFKEHMTPDELLQSKRAIANQITTWDKNTTNIRQRYLQGLYADINHAIETALPPDEAKAFRAHNQIQTRLIVAREAAKEKLVAQQLKDDPGIVTKLVNRVAGGAVGAVSGATIARETGSNEGHGAVIGGMIGAGLGSYARHLGKSAYPVADIAAQRAIVKAAPYIAKAAKVSPHAVRGVQAVIDSIQSRPQ